MEIPSSVTGHGPETLRSPKYKKKKTLPQIVVRILRKVLAIHHKNSRKRYEKKDNSYFGGLDYVSLDIDQKKKTLKKTSHNFLKDGNEWPSNTSSKFQEKLWIEKVCEKVCSNRIRKWVNAFLQGIYEIEVPYFRIPIKFNWTLIKNPKFEKKKKHFSEILSVGEGLFF